jgi:hypothetical protein
MGEIEFRHSGQTGRRETETSGVLQSRQSDGKKTAERPLTTVLRGATKLVRGSTRWIRRFLAKVSQLMKTDLRFQVGGLQIRARDLAGWRYQWHQYMKFAAGLQCRPWFLEPVHCFFT